MQNPPTPVSNPPADFDGAWKEAMERYLQGLMELCFSGIAARVAWEKGFEFLDKELQEVVRDGELGKQRVDKLVKVHLRDGESQWILFHIEVASQPYVKLERTMYQYHHRLEDRYNQPVLSVAVLADNEPGWRPEGVYERDTLGCRLRFEFPVCKLLDFAKDWAALEDDPNPAAIVVMAHLRALQSSTNMPLRLRYKWELTRALYKRKNGLEEVLELYRLIDWLLTLPDELKLAFRQQVVDYEVSTAMPYITSIEMIGREEGRKEGREEGREEGERRVVLRQLRKRFGDIPPATQQAVDSLPLAALEEFGDALLDFASVSELEAWLESQSRH